MHHLNRRVCVILAGLMLAAGAPARGANTVMSPADDLSARGPFAVKVLEFSNLTDASRGRLVPIKVHLPSTDAPVPVVVVSHGGGGNWDANFAQSHHLATHGYAVLAVEHIGSNTAVIKRSLRIVANLEAMTRDANEVLGRPRDIRFAIDQAEQWNRTHEAMRGRLDLKRVGMLGHSYGAYTTLVIAGMRPALNWLEPTVAPGQGLGPDLRDERVRCGIALSPQGPGEPFFIDASYVSLRTPMLGISGSKDAQQRAGPENRRRAFELWPDGDKYLVWLTDADHTAFSDSTGARQPLLPSATRAVVQPLVRAATLLFFNAYLKEDAEARRALSRAGLQPYWRGTADGIEVLSK
jgi:predicted dienelactone hydrolase